MGDRLEPVPADNLPADNLPADNLPADNLPADSLLAADQGSVARERDERGRPRNARPRDALGRPLSRGESGAPGVPDDLVLPPHEALVEAQRLLDEGRPFHAHEVLEATWKAAPAAERDLWQGLAQLAVGLTHALRGNTVGAATLLRRGADHISGYAERPPHGIDATGLLEWARTLSRQLDDASSDVGPPTVPKLVSP